ncbi:XrtN system VIT domain protein [Mucilaginibacter gracilis]|uniref:XrtN system VIT domain protein n=1 Tax=Mucilaginibacter gracilis TaxID=423350 RepID=A0A495J339_9SPHI|nr:XrtN system VIT domain-containing protein [Mucilaginibacter gracilis]RKR82429.1 XrtN system VIT domain protein [Mucilaginibacter gracilis]
MKKLKSLLPPDGVSTTGLVLVIFSAIIFASTARLEHRSISGVFFINYLLSVVYLLTVFIRTFSLHGWKLSHGKLEHTVLLLILWFISAFALNREMAVFYNSVNWLCIWLFISSVTLLFVALYKPLSGIFKYVVFCLLGAALLLFTYYTIFLLPLYIISFIGIIAIGISLHTFVPLLLTTVTAIIVIRAAKQDAKVIYAVLSGFLLPVMLCAIFLIKWNTANKQINLILNQSTLNGTKLPAWVLVSQRIKKSSLTERMLKAGLVYHAANPDGNLFWSGMPSHSFDQPKEHDPFVVIATLLFKKPNLDEEERIKILKSMYDARHHAQERLWSGDELETVSVISNVKLFPEYRMAYTEKTLSIRNNSVSTWSKQEAIYTFHLSEGSVVSSLSLWINGTEQKSRLTTKAKADSAYHQIVGVESHDPSVIHWQEGNTVSVRIFPVTSTDNRKFKIGISSPLKKTGNRLVYENPYFEGPAADGALETMQLSFSEQPKNLLIPTEFEKSSTDVYRANRDYEPDWEVSFSAPALANAVFAFADTAYQVKQYSEQLETFDPTAIYIDLNNAWSKEELKQILDEVKTKPVYVFQDKLIKLNADNLNEIYQLMADQNFTLFPVQEIANADKALLISKSNETAPNLNDLDGSEFASGLTHYLKHKQSIRFYNIGDKTSPYLKALKELRVLNYTSGTETNLLALLNKHQFVKNQENDSLVVLNGAQLAIQKTKGAPTLNAPDHLLRLFAYNDIMKKVGTSYFSGSYIQPDIINEAQKAYVVSPVSSLIVLETKKDYERFGIDESKNSLKNASMQSSGSVPEPREWLIVIVALVVICWLTYKPKIGEQNNLIC